jgi:hypothetical protein
MATSLLTYMRDYLVAEGLVRKPSVAGALPPLWLEPAEGTPAPGEGDNATEIGSTLVLSASLATGIPREPYTGQWLRTDAIQFVVRASAATGALQAAFDLETEIKRRFDDRRAYNMGALLVLESRMFRGLQRVSSNREQGYVMTTEYTFERTNLLPPMP